MPKSTTFGDLLPVVRKEHGVLQREVAEAAGVALASVCDWEKGRRSPPTSARSLLIAKLFEAKGAPVSVGAELITSAARTRGSFHFETENEFTLELLTAICMKEGSLNKKKVAKLIKLL